MTIASKAVRIVQFTLCEKDHVLVLPISMLAANCAKLCI